MVVNSNDVYMPVKTSILFKKLSPIGFLRLVLRQEKIRESHA